MIIYTVVCRARDISILIEVSSPDLGGNAPQVTTNLLQHLRRNPTPEGERRTFVQRNASEQNDVFSLFMESCAPPLGGEDGWVEENYFHLILRKGVYFCCIGDDRDLRDQKVNFAFLDSVSDEFFKRHKRGRIDTANAYALQKDFAPTIRSVMHHHNVNHTSIAREERVQRLVAKVDDMHKILGKQMDLMLKRERKIDRLKTMTDGLQDDVSVFKRRAVRLKRRSQRRYCARWSAYYALLTGIILVVSYILLTAFCGRDFQYCRIRKHLRSNSSNGGNEQYKNEP